MSHLPHQSNGYFLPSPPIWSYAPIVPSGGSPFYKFHLLLNSILILREPSITSGLLNAQSEAKENEAPDGNSSVVDAIKARSPQADQSREAPRGNGSEDAIKANSSPVNKSNASCIAANEYAGNTWEKYYMATVEEPVGSVERSDGAEQPLGEDARGDKYVAIALLDDDQEEEKWSERTTVITALDHQVREIVKPNVKYEK